MPPRSPRFRLQLFAGTFLCIAGCLFLAKAAFDANRMQHGDGQAQAGATTLAPPVAAGATNTPYAPGPNPEMSDATSLAELEIVRNGEVSDVFVSNRLPVPLEIQLGLTEAKNIITVPALPLTQLLPPDERVLVSRVQPGADGVASYALRMSATPGDPRAMPDDVVYSLPVDDNSNWEMGQAFHGGFSHTDAENRYAVDLIVREGVPILAARGGVVFQAEGGFDRAGLNRKKYSSRANVIRILHDDGTMAVYAHLKENGVFVNVGDRVGIGQQIGLSGNTGYTSGPHLHFCLQVNRGMRLVSIPFRMVGGDGFLPLPR